MAERGPDHPRTGWAASLNLLIPGSGQILVGSLWSGLLVGLVFAACASLALAAVLLFPDDFSRGSQALLIGLAAGSYVGAQVRMVQTVRAARDTAMASWRRRIMWEVRALVERGEYTRAAELLEPLVEQAPQDLLVAYRHAQVLSQVGSPEAARRAWQRVQALDRHGLYKEQIRAFGTHSATTEHPLGTTENHNAGAR